MTRAEMIQTLQTCHTQLLELLEGTSEEILGKRPVVGWWTTKDLLGHIAMWEQVAIQFITEYQRDGMPQPLGMETDEQINAINKREVVRRRDWTLARVRAEFDATYCDLVAAIQSLRDEDFIQPLGGAWQDATLEKLIAINSYEHIPEHIAQISAILRK